MSMFHELMMRKKEEIMYATINGSLTESPEGVFSGFSSSNYLKINYNPADFYAHNYEFFVKVKFTSEDISANQEQYAICYNVGTNTRRGIGVSSGKLVFAFSYNTGQQGLIASNITATPDIYYWLLGKYENGIMSFSYSTDGKNYTLVGTLDISAYSKLTFIPNFYIGAYPSSNYGIIKGDVDLNRSYIKIDDTKYKIVAVPEE